MTNIKFDRIVRIKVLQKLCFLIQTQSSATSSISSLFCRRIDLDVGDDHFLARTSRVPSVNFKLKKLKLSSNFYNIVLWGELISDKLSVISSFLSYLLLHFTVKTIFTMPFSGLQGNIPSYHYYSIMFSYK